MENYILIIPMYFSEIKRFWSYNPLSAKFKVEVTLCQRALRHPLSFFNFTHLWFCFRRGTFFHPALEGLTRELLKLIDP